MSHKASKRHSLSYRWLTVLKARCSLSIFRPNQPISQTPDNPSLANAEACSYESTFKMLAHANVNKLKFSAFTPGILFFTFVKLRPDDAIFDHTRRVAEHMKAKRNLGELSRIQNTIRGNTAFSEAIHDFCACKQDVPFVALDTELIGALATAEELSSQSARAHAFVGALDLTKLNKECIARCNDLRIATGAPWNSRYSSMILAWAELPEEAVIFNWEWDAFRESDIVRKWFPILQENPSPGNSVLEKWLEFPGKFKNASFDIFTLSLVLERSLGIKTDQPVTRQIIEIFTAWSRGYPKMRMNQLEHIIPDLKSQIDDWFDIIIVMKEYYYRDFADTPMNPSVNYR
ncbi:hypothetical protein CC78DRAFT_578730 [Lojkania enalia]|uniref:Uncharacterized protein n=1 Tax=Lojkania enalia TaxID=147567 RepID=A0A9P4KDK0_9PLEO|nr:hypothetical protein CC78DRAFT_578730 [Didymosphaeria enalia]